MRSNWKKVMIDQICNIKRGASPRPIHDYLSSDGMPWVKIADATSNNSRFITKTKQFITIDGIPKTVKVNPGTLILSNSATPGLPKFMSIEACVHDGWLILSDFNDINKEFLYYLLLNERPKLVNNANGSVFNNLKIDIVKQHEIEIPPLSLQIKIKDILLSLDDKIELNNQINKNLEDMAQSIFKRWFVDFEFPNENGDPYKSSGGEFEESELGLIPKGWKVGKIEDIAKNRKGTLKPSEIPNGTSYVGLEHIPRKNLSMHNMGVSDDLGSNKTCFHKNDILFGKLRPYFHKVSIAPVDGVCSTDIIVIHSTLDDYYGYLISHLFSKRIIDYVTQNSNGTKMPRTNWKDISRYTIVIPDLRITKRFTDIFRSFIEQMHNNIYENKRLVLTRDTLLPKLMSREIRVPMEEEETDKKREDEVAASQQ